MISLLSLIGLLYYVALSDSTSLYDEYIFTETCDTSEYFVSSPATTFPNHIEKPSFDPDFVDIKKWYDVGLEECNRYLSTHAAELGGKPTSPPLSTKQPTRKVVTCRGNALVYQTTGLLVWAFGPVAKCPPYSKCWFGLLTCGMCTLFMPPLASLT